MKRELLALLSLSSWCLVIEVWLFLAVSMVCLQFVIVVFPDHTYLLFLMSQLLCLCCVVTVNSFPVLAFNVVIINIVRFTLESIHCISFPIDVTRFSEHYHQYKKAWTIDNFLYRHFKQTNLRHELELKWIKLLKTTHPLGFNDNIYHGDSFSRFPGFDGFFSLLDIRKCNKQSHCIHKKEI